MREEARAAPAAETEPMRPPETEPAPRAADEAEPMPAPRLPQPMPPQQMPPPPKPPPPRVQAGSARGAPPHQPAPALRTSPAGAAGGLRPLSGGKAPIELSPSKAAPSPPAPAPAPAPRPASVPSLDLVLSSGAAARRASPPPPPPPPPSPAAAASAALAAAQFPSTSARQPAAGPSPRPAAAAPDDAQLRGQLEAFCAWRARRAASAHDAEQTLEDLDRLQSTMLKLQSECVRQRLAAQLLVNDSLMLRWPAASLARVAQGVLEKVGAELRRLGAAEE